MKVRKANSIVGDHLHESPRMNCVWASPGKQMKYFNQIKTGIEIFRDDKCQVTLDNNYSYSKEK